MDCRPGCGACCIAPSIAGPIPGMPEGKPAGVVCVQLDEAYRCKLFGQPSRPDLCNHFQAEVKICAQTQEEALINIAILEGETRP